MPSPHIGFIEGMRKVQTILGSECPKCPIYPHINYYSRFHKTQRKKLIRKMLGLLPEIQNIGQKVKECGNKAITNILQTQRNKNLVSGRQLKNDLRKEQ